MRSMTALFVIMKFECMNSPRNASVPLSMQVPSTTELSIDTIFPFLDCLYMMYWLLGVHVACSICGVFVDLRFDIRHKKLYVLCIMKH